MNRSRWLPAAALTLVVAVVAVVAVLMMRDDDGGSGTRRHLTVVVGNLPKDDRDRCTADGMSAQRIVGGHVTVTPAGGNATTTSAFSGAGALEASNSAEAGPSDGCFWTVELDVADASSYAITADLPRGDSITKNATRSDLEQLGWRIRLSKHFT